MTEAGCIVCKSDLVYLEESEEMHCSICSSLFRSNAKCLQGHFVCDTCHGKDAYGYIETFCAHTQSANPLEIAQHIMNNSMVKMHGPEHHFLVPASLIAAYYNAAGQSEQIPAKLAVARERSMKVPGGFCGMFGNCGAGVGTGIFYSIITGCTPLSKEEWKFANLITATSLKKIAERGGPRCCKRNTYTALETAVEFLQNNMNVTLESTAVKCIHSAMNKECLRENCVFFIGARD